MRCRSRDIENSRRNDKEVARLLRGWKVLAASTIVAITIILCYGIVQSESISSLLNAVASGGTANTTTVTDDDYNNEVEGRFLSEDNQDNEEHIDNEEHQEEDAEVAYDDDDDDDDASSQTSSSFSLNVNMPKFSMDGTEVFFLAFMLVIVLILLPRGCQILKDRKALNSRFGIGLLSSALIMYANLSFLFSLLLSYSNEVRMARWIHDIYKCVLTCLIVRSFIP